MSDYLYITEFDEVNLPEEFHFSHNIAVKLYEDLAWILKNSKIQKKLNLTIKFKDEDNVPKVNEEDIIGWLIKNKYQKEANEAVSKHIVFALISDVCKFLFQSLDSSKNINMTVAYSLIRKPFLENLIIIEQLFSNQIGFLQKFEGKPEDFDPGKLNDEEKKFIIKHCLSKIKTKIGLQDDLIFELRFNKKNPKSFYAMSNLATHLVTTRHPEFKTETNNLNLIFSNYKDLESQLRHYYKFVPYMLLYLTELVDQYLLEKKMIDLKTFKKRKFLRLIGQILNHDQFTEKSSNKNSIANKIAKTLKIKCNNCNKINQLFKSDLFYLTQHNYMLCKFCLVDLCYESSSLETTINKIIK